MRVVERAQSFRDVLDVDELEVLLAAAYLHDIGYAPELAEADFHALDGARFVRDSRHERLAGLVAHHSASDAEAEEPGEGARAQQILEPLTNPSWLDRDIWRL